MTSNTGVMDPPPSPGVPRLPEPKLDLSLSLDSFGTMFEEEPAVDPK